MGIVGQASPQVKRLALKQEFQAGYKGPSEPIPHTFSASGKVLSKDGEHHHLRITG